MSNQKQILEDVAELVAALKDQLGPVGVAIADKWAKELESSVADVYKGPDVLYAVTLRMINEDGVVERLEALTSTRRVGVLKFMYQGMLWPAVIHDHLDVLEVAGYPEFISLRYRTGPEMQEFQQNMMKASSSHFVYSTMSEKLNTYLEQITGYTDDQGIFHFMTDLEMTEFLILRSVFGEDILTEVLGRGIKEYSGRFQPSAASLIPILQDWGNLKDYPISWSLNVTSKNYDKASKQAVIDDRVKP